MGSMLLFIILIVGTLGIAVVGWASSPRRGFSGSVIITNSITAPTNPTPNLKIGTYNIGFAAGIEHELEWPSNATVKQNLDHICAFIQDQNLDIMCLQEVDRPSHRSANIDQLTYIQGHTTLKHLFYCPIWNKRYVPFPPNPKHHIRHVSSGIAILSRHPISNPKVFNLPTNHRNLLRRLFELKRKGQTCDIHIGSNTISVANTHLAPFNRNARIKQAMFLSEKLVSENTDILCGDMNAIPTTTPDAPTLRYFDLIHILANDPTIPIFQANGWGTNTPETPTYPAGHPKHQLDYVMTHPQTLWQRSNIQTADTSASDHLALVAELHKARP